MSVSSVRIRKAEATDMGAVFGLVQELAAYEKAADQVETSPERYVADGFDGRPLFECFVAEEGEEIVGIALFYFGYSTWKGKLGYLDDLVVKETHRRRGIGRQLIKAFIQYAHRQGAHMVRWQVLDWNESAIEMYKSLGAVFENQWIDVKLYPEQINPFLD